MNSNNFMDHYTFDDFLLPWLFLIPQLYLVISGNLVFLHYKHFFSSLALNSLVFNDSVQGCYLIYGVLQLSLYSFRYYYCQKGENLAQQ